MEPSVIIWIVVFVVVVAVATVAIVARLVSMYVPWEILPGFTARFYSKSTPGWRIAEALEFAIQAIIENTAYPPLFVRQTANKLNILIVQASTWTNITGQRVGGEADGYEIKVGEDLSALMHELAHVIETDSANGVPNHNHEDWDVKGLWAADNAYRRALNG